MSLALYLSDSVTPATGLSFGTVASGAESTTITIHVKNTAASTLRDCWIGIEVDDGTGTYKVAGLTALDQHWIRARVVGGSNVASDPTMTLNTSDWVSLGTGKRLALDPIPTLSFRYIELKLRAPNVPGVATAVPNFRLVPFWSEGSYGIAGGLPESGQGIISGIGDGDASEWIDAPTNTATGTPNDYSNLSAARLLIRGVEIRAAAESHQWNQLDSAASALTSGQAYIATISRSATTYTYTKGLRATAASAVAPTAPAGEIVGTVKVRYSATTTEILSTDITTTAENGQFVVSTGTGLTPKVGPGRALLAGAFVKRTSTQSPLCVANATNRLWLASDAGVIVNQSDTPPATGLQLLAHALTNASSVISVIDKRKLLRPNPAFDVPIPSAAVAAAPKVLGRTESGTLWTNDGAQAKAYFTLPSPEAGLVFSFLVTSSYGLRVEAPGGYAESSTVGDLIVMRAVDGTRWIGTSSSTGGFSIVPPPLAQPSRRIDYAAWWSDQALPQQPRVHQPQ